MEINEAREVRVREGETTFLADHSSGRLIVREEGEEGNEVCAVTVGNREELDAFLTGLRRVLGVGEGRDREADGGRGGGHTGAGRKAATDRALGTAEVADGRSPDSDRDAAIERARERNPQAFKSWTRAEEQRLAEAYERGATLVDLAREHQRSERAVDMRLQKLGLR